MDFLKRLLSAVLAIAILCTLLAVPASALSYNSGTANVSICYWANADGMWYQNGGMWVKANDEAAARQNANVIKNTATGKAIPVMFVSKSSTDSNPATETSGDYAWMPVFVFCLERDTGSHNRDNHTINSNMSQAKIWASLGKEATTGISLVLKYGFPNVDRGSANAYAATQCLIWDFQKGYLKVVENSDGTYSLTGTPTNIPSHTGAKNYYYSMIDKIKGYCKTPNYTNLTNGSAELKWNGSNYSWSGTDTNGVLSNFVFASNSAKTYKSGSVTATISGNTLTITSSSPLTTSVNFNFKKIDTTTTHDVLGQKFVVLEDQVYNDSGVLGQTKLIGSPGDPVETALKAYTQNVGNLEITKKNEDGQLVPGYTFQITHTGTGTKYSAVTDANGIASFSNLPIGTYSVTEDLDANKTNFPQYTVQNISNVTVNSNATSSLTVTNDYVTGQLKIYKTDGETKYPVAGAKFGVYSDANCTNLIETVITDSTGTATTSKLRYGTYYFKELEAPEGYLLEESTFDVTITADGQVVDKTVENDYISGYLKIYKTDGETKTPVRGAKFGVYAKQDISFGGKTYKAGDLVDTVVTDANGEATTKNLRYGDYYFKELEAPEGYILDENSFDVTISVNGKTEEKEVVNDYISGHLKIYKTDGETKYPVSDAVFGVYTKQDISFGGKTYKAGDIVDTVTTDKNGKATTKALRYGSYYFKELVAPAGYLLEESSFDFKITTNNATVERTVENDYIAGYLKIYKTDGETKTPVRDAVFDVYTKQDISFGGKTYKAGDLVDTVVTDANGEAVTKELRYGSYYFKERTAPYGYILEEKSALFDITTHNETVKITVDEAVKYLNLEVYKKGEVLTGFTETETDFGTQYTPIYKEQYLAGAVYDVYAAEDIVIGGTGTSQDGDKGTRTIYKKGELVDTITTVSTGKALSKDLPVGEYTVKERIAPNGYFIGENSETVDLQTKNESVVFDNDRTKLTIDFTKYIEENENYPNPDAYKDMVFALYAKNDICGIDGNVLLEADSLVDVITIDKDVSTQIKVGENGDPLLDEDGNPVMEKVVTYIDTDASDLPIADYYLKEVKTAEGYVLNETVFEVPFATNITVDTKDKDGNVITRYNQDIDMWTEDVGEIVNNVYRGTFGFEKTSSFDGRKLEGATYGIYRASDDELIYTLVTDENGIAVQKDIPYGEYYLQEIQPPQFKLTNSIVVEKYYLNEEKIYFSINDKELPVQHVYTTNDAKFGTLVPIQEETPLIYIPKDLITIDVDTPLTGDSTPIAGTVAILCTSALGVMVMKMKRKEVENDE